MNSANVRTECRLARHLSAIVLSSALIFGCLPVLPTQTAYAEDDTNQLSLALALEEVVSAEVASGDDLEELAATSLAVSPTATSITPSVKQEKTFTVTVNGSTQGWVVSLSGNRSRYTRVDQLSDTRFQVVVDLSEPSGVLYATVTSCEDPSVQTVVPITVNNKPLITEVRLQYNASAFVANPSTTGALLTDLIRTYVTAPLNQNYYVDTSNYNVYSHLCYYVDGAYVSLANSTSPLDPEKQYFLRVCIEEEDAFWPTNPDELAIYINDEPLDEVNGSFALAYSYGSLGSVNVYLPVEWSDTSVVYLGNFSVKEYSGAGTALVYLENAFMEDSLSVPLFRGCTMLYVPDYEAWCSVLDPGENMPEAFDFTSSTTASLEEKAQYKVAKPGYEDYGLAGDVNGSGKLTIVDAQNAYDAARGAYRISSDLPIRSWLAADVNHNQYLDLSDVLYIQYALLFGWN